MSLTIRPSWIRAAVRICAFLLSVSIQTGFTQTAEDQTAEDASVPDEEVIVTAPRPTKRLLNEIGEATEKFYDDWNSWLEGKNRDFKVVCVSEAPQGSRIRRRVCRPRYQLAEISKVTRAAMVGSFYDPRPVLMESGEAMARLMLDAANEDPSLNDALQQLTKLKAEYESRIEEDRAQGSDD